MPDPTPKAPTERRGLAARRQQCVLCTQQHETLCDSCCRCVCHGCSVDYEGIRVCVECNAAMREEAKVMDDA